MSTPARALNRAEMAMLEIIDIAGDSGIQTTLLYDHMKPIPAPEKLDFVRSTGLVESPLDIDSEDPETRRTDLQALTASGKRVLTRFREGKYELFDGDRATPADKRIPYILESLMAQSKPTKDAKVEPKPGQEATVTRKRGGGRRGKAKADASNQGDSHDPSGQPHED